MKNSIFLKSIAFFLAVICFVTALASGIAIAALASEKLYTSTPEDLQTAYYDQTGYNAAYYLSQYYAATVLGNCPEKLVDFLYGPASYAMNYTHAMVYQDTELVYTAGTDVASDVLRYFDLMVTYPKLVDAAEAQDTIVLNGTLYYVAYEKIPLTVSIAISPELFQSDVLVLPLYPYRFALIALLALTLMGGIAAFIYLMWVAGRNKDGQIAPGGLCLLPLDVHLVLDGLLSFFGLYLLYQLAWEMRDLNIIPFAAVGAGVLGTMGLGFLYCFAAQLKVKGGYWWRHSLCGACLCRIGRFLRSCLRGIKAVFEMLPVIGQWLGIAFGMAFLLLVSAMIAFGSSYLRINSFVLVFLALCLGCVISILYGGWCFGHILTGAKKMAEGQLEYRIPEEKLFGSFKTCARQLNSLSGAADKAVQGKMRSERMKTELITNVSHDIKTPLTSIINFVDLLEKPHTEEEGKQYLEVLSRQSQSLKKLIEDLMDLSKASTGNMAVNLTTLDAVEAARQALGEFSDKLEKAQLTPVFRAPETPLPITADGRLVWRVLSNLLGNAVKYAAPNTRLYLEVAQAESHVTISIRNISREELNVTAEELLERFVQGDASRNTEGSGLGLNIAKSLMEVQHGQLDLTLDGDLFKVTLIFPKA